MAGFVQLQSKCQRRQSAIAASPDHANKRRASFWNFSRTRLTEVGNQALQRQLRAQGLRPKFIVNRPGDRYEQEADRVAEQVMRMAEPSTVMKNPAVSPPSSLQRRTDNRSVDVATAPTNLNKMLSSQGHPLDADTRDFFEPRFGYDFSRVRIHTGTDAIESACGIEALAYTTGNSIVWGAGLHMDQTMDGRKLLAHELTHIVQQDMSPSLRSGTLPQKDLAAVPLFEQLDDAMPQIIRQSGAPSGFIFRQDLPPEEEFEEPFEFDEESSEMEEEVDEEPFDMEEEDYDEEPFDVEEDEELFNDELGEASQEVVDPCDEMWKEIKPLLMKHEACSEIETLYWEAKYEESARAELRQETNQTMSDKKALEDKTSELKPDLPEQQELHDEQLQLLESQNEVLIENRDWAKAIWDLTLADQDTVGERYQPKEQEILKIIEKLIALHDFITKTGEKSTISPLEVFHLWAALNGILHYTNQLNQLMPPFENLSAEFDMATQAASSALDDYKFEQKFLSENEELINTLRANDPRTEIRQLEAKIVVLDQRLHTKFSKIDESIERTGKIDADTMNANLACYHAAQADEAAPKDPKPGDPKVYEKIKRYLIQCENHQRF